MSKKLTIAGEVADKQYNLRTTPSIMETLVEKAGQKDSVNVLINKILLSWKKKFDNHKIK
jgi:predicted HicB family RNase H-like nuclease